MLAFALSHMRLMGFASSAQPMLDIMFGIGLGLGIGQPGPGQSSPKACKANNIAIHVIIILMIDSNLPDF